MGTAGTPPLKWAPFPLGLPRMGGVSAWAEPGQMGFQDGAETSWDLLLIWALGGDVHVWLQLVISAWKRGRVGPPGGRGAPRASRSLGVTRPVGWPHRSGTPEGLPAGRAAVCDPFPPGGPSAWGTCEGGGSPPDPRPLRTRQGVGREHSCSLGLLEPRFPAWDSWSLGGQSRLRQRCALGSAPWSRPFSGSILCGPGVREVEKSLPALPAPIQDVSTLQPQGARQSRTCGPSQVCPGWGGPRCPALPWPLSAPEGRTGGSRP